MNEVIPSSVRSVHSLLLTLTLHLAQS